MRRLVVTAALAGLLTPLVLLLPLVGNPAPATAPAPVPPAVFQLALPAVVAPAAASAAPAPPAVAVTPPGPRLDRPHVLTAAVPTRHFTTLGVTWQHDPEV
ncbi:MAG TPA: hypothetical protein VNA30_05665, partial [Mycobacteriales bacterium]|nr:hypothetical protein [Mycobacteriales bacterium]